MLPTKTKTHLYQNLKYFRLTHNLTQREIATYLNVDRSTYSYWETGRTEPPLYIIQKLTKFYNVDYNTLLSKR